MSKKIIAGSAIKDVIYEHTKINISDEEEEIIRQYITTSNPETSISLLEN
jgi:hypothetical protein